MIVLISCGIDVEMFGSLIILVFGVFIKLFSFVRLLDCCRFVGRFFGKVEMIWFVSEIFLVLMFKFVVEVKE